MSKSRIHQILTASMEDVEADAAAAAAAEAAAAPAADVVVDAAPAAAEADAVVADVVVDAEPAVAADEIADPDTLEADLIDVGQAEAEVQTNTDAVSELEDVQEGLEAIALSLESAQAEGGLTPQSANYFQIAFEAYAHRIGEDVTVPSLESFGGQTSRVDATTVSLESVRDVLAKVWEAIKSICIKIRDAIVSFFKQLMSGAERLRVRAEKVKAAASKASGNAKSADIELGSLAAKIAIGAKAEVNNAKVSEIAAVAASALEFDDAASSHLVKDFEALRQAVNSGERVQSAGELAAPKAFSKQVTGGVATELLPGNTTFSIVVNTGIGATGKAATQVNKFLAGGWSVTKEVAKTEVSNDIKIKTLDFAAITHIADECLKIADIADKGNKQIAANGAATAKGLKDLKVSKDVAEDKVAGVKADMKAFQKRCAAQDQATTKVLAWAVGTGRAYLAVAEKSLAQYGNQTAVVAAA